MTSRSGADGEQTRSFMFIDDCVKGIEMIMHRRVEQPINLGSSQLVSINQLVDIVESIAGVKLRAAISWTRRAACPAAIATTP